MSERGREKGRVSIFVEGEDEIRKIASKDQRNEHHCLSGMWFGRTNSLVRGSFQPQHGPVYRGGRWSIEGKRFRGVVQC